MINVEEEMKRLRRKWAQPHDRVCAKCIDDDDLIAWINNENGPRGCDFCNKKDAPTASIDELGEFMRGHLQLYYGDANSELPYDSAEDGYQAVHWSTYEVLYENIGLGLPRDQDDRLAGYLADAVSDQEWCEYDWLRLDIDEALESAWRSLCETVQHKRRFFFARPAVVQAGDEDAILDEDEILGPFAILVEIARQLEGSEAVLVLPAGTKLYRARSDDGHGPYKTAAALGPPPAELANQSNRMNPAGIPMTYMAETAELAVAEVREQDAYVGTFRTTRAARLLDLTAIPATPGFFSGVDRRLRLGRAFLNRFEREIMKPVERSDRIHVEYIPSQVVTEFFREFGIGEKPIDGIRYRSTLDAKGRNVVLFATQENVVGALPPEPWRQDKWLKLVQVRRHVAEA